MRPSSRILIVDDEPVTLEILSVMLGRAGYDTRQACSGMEALAVLGTEGEFDLVLSDLMMAEIDGLALVEKTRDKFPDMPVVMVHGPWMTSPSPSAPCATALMITC